MATANLNQPTSAANGNIPYIGATANDDSGNTIRDSFSRLNDRIKEIYGAQDGSNVVQTPFVDGDNIKDDIITESHLDVTNSPVDGYVLTYDSASSGFTWEQKFDGDITGIFAGDGLTGDATSGDANLAVGAGTGITVNANDIQISDGGVDTTQLAADAVDGTKIADDAIDSEHYVDGSIDTAHFSLTAAINVNVDQNSGTLKLWSGTQAQYDALTPDASTLYFIV